jgi:chlorophyll synthase
MTIPQVIVALLLLRWDLTLSAALVGLLIFGQIMAMRKLLIDPEKYAPWYNATGVLMFVSGMMICAFGLRGAANI